MYQALRKIPIAPRGGRSRQNRQNRGRSASSSEGEPKALVTMPRGSIHSLSRFARAPFPAPSTPANMTITGKSASRSRLWTSSSSPRSAEARLRYSARGTEAPTSAGANSSCAASRSERFFLRGALRVAISGPGSR